MNQEDNISKCILYSSYFMYINALCNIMNHFNILTFSKYFYYISSFLILEKKDALLLTVSHDIIVHIYRDMNMLLNKLYILFYLSCIYVLVTHKRVDSLFVCILKIGNAFIKDSLDTIIPYPQRFVFIVNDIKHASIIETWVNDRIMNKSGKTTKHWWYNSLTLSPKDSFDEIRCKILEEFEQHLDNLGVESIEDMDEIYVSANNKIENSSDTVFYSKHIDGPYYLFPFCSVYRCIYAVNTNINISTYIDRTNEKFTLTKGDCLLFDFNREIHYISKNEIIQKTKSFDSNSIHRITLKIHFITYPKNLRHFAMILKYLNVQYNKNARKLFLYTISPKSLYEKLVAKQILYITKATYLIEKYISFQAVTLCFLWCFIVKSV